MAAFANLTEDLSSWQETARALNELNLKLGPRLEQIDKYADIRDGAVGEAIQSSFDDAKALIDAVKEDESRIDVAGKIAAIEARLTLMEQRAAGEDSEDRRGNGTDKIDARDTSSWAGPHIKEFTEYQCGFHISLDATKQGLGQWAEWASKKSLL